MIKTIAIVIFFALVSISPLVYAGPQLASDIAVGGHWTPADDLATKEADCKRWYFLVSTCDIKYVDRNDPGRVGGTLSYLVFGSWSGERIRLMRSITDPGRIGTTVGIEHMRQRMISFGLFVLLVVAYLVGLLRFLLLAWGTTSRPPAAGTGSEPSMMPPMPPAGPRAFGRRASGSLG